MNERDKVALDAIIAEYHWYPGDAIIRGFVSGLGHRDGEINRLRAMKQEAGKAIQAAFSFIACGPNHPGQAEEATVLLRDYLEKYSVEEPKP